MLQFATQSEATYSVPEQCQMVIEGGCAWIQLCSALYSEDEIFQICETLVPLCRETETFLIIEDREDIAERLRLHGIHLSIEKAHEALSVREKLGPHAIIGVQVDNADIIDKLYSADIDYISVDIKLPATIIESIITKATTGQSIIPIVLSGELDDNQIENSFRTGASGVCLGKKILEAENPTEYTSHILSLLKNKRK